jgi:hypothetical protein
MPTKKPKNNTIDIMSIPKRRPIHPIFLVKGKV